MRKTGVFGFLGFLLLASGTFFVLDGRASDKIYLKNGTVYEGKLIGKSEKRFLFSVEADGEKFQMSFFPEEVEKIELDKDSMDKQVPYLKEVETLKVKVKDEKPEEKPRVYELSLYKESVGAIATPEYSEIELKKALSKDEVEYYQRFNDILQKYMDKFAMIQNLYVNLTTATRDDFAQAKQYMDEIYFELNNIFVPEAFKKSHMAYLESVKSSFLAFNALEQGMLDEASKQLKISEETKQRSMSEFRQVIVSRKTQASEAPQENVPQPSPSNEIGNSQ
jgi:hypothetical protein